jgi:hypothetical protein
MEESFVSIWLTKTQHSWTNNYAITNELDRISAESVTPLNIISCYKRAHYVSENRQVKSARHSMNSIYEPDAVCTLHGYARHFSVCGNLSQLQPWQDTNLNDPHFLNLVNFWENLECSTYHNLCSLHQH